jgi:proprotein convertase subtilisin/kexin type 5
MCVCEPGYTSGAGTCSACYTIMPGCLNCTSSSSCSICDIGSGFLFNPFNSDCFCPTGTYFSLSALSPSTVACFNCSSAIPGCLACTSNTTCTLCNSLLTLTLSPSADACICQTGFYLDGSCQSCSAAMTGCISCTSSSVCTMCDASKNFQASGQECACSPAYFLDFSLVCVACATGCTSCSGSSSNCQSCVSSRILFGTTCTCPLGTYASGATCSSCDSAC